MRAFGITDIGRTRQINQDCFFVSETQMGPLPNLYIVADGMGGHSAGEIASRSAVDGICEYVKNCTEADPITVIQRAIDNANEKVFSIAKTNSECYGMGTTLVVTTVLEDVFYVANIGDSRLYVINDDVHQITRDHSYVAEMVSRGELDKDSARTHEKKNVITRAVGIEPTTFADYFRVKYKKGDKILMCSDGLSNMIRDEELKNIIKKNHSIQEIVEELIVVANQNGGLDNVTAVVIEL